MKKTYTMRILPKGVQPPFQYSSKNLTREEKSQELRVYNQTLAKVIKEFYDR